MRKLLPILLITLCFGCASNKASDSILPDPLKGKIQFGMTLDDFKQLKSKAKLTYNTDDSFRVAIIEEIEHPEISNYVYYFDTDDDKPLYEIIVIYKTEAQRDAVAEKLFGEPNFEGGEWRFKRPKSFNVMAWKYKTKLIIVALLPKTEWAEDPSGTW
jgi:hypothetical protein